MKLPKRGEKGFTLIELLIVIAILGVLAAVIIPNVGRFFGRGETEARRTEKDSVQAAVDNMMADNGLAEIPNLSNAETAGDDTATNTMTGFPDSTSTTTDKLKDPGGTNYTYPGDKVGYLLNGHDIEADAAATPLVDYLRETTTKYYYTVEADGTVHQYPSATATQGTEYTD